MYGISITFHQFFLTLKIFYIKIKKFSIKSWTRRTYIYVANTSFLTYVTCLYVKSAFPYLVK